MDSYPLENGCFADHLYIHFDQNVIRAWLWLKLLSSLVTWSLPRYILWFTPRKVPLKMFSKPNCGGFELYCKNGENNAEFPFGKYKKLDDVSKTFETQNHIIKLSASWIINDNVQVAIVVKWNYTLGYTSWAAKISPLSTGKEATLRYSWRILQKTTDPVCTSCRSHCDD